MSNPINIVITDATAPISQTDLSTPYLLATDKVVPLQKISSVDDITGAIVSDTIYKMATSLLGARSQEVWIQGIAAPTNPDTEILEVIKNSGVAHYFLSIDTVDTATRTALAGYYGTRVGLFSSRMPLTATADEAIAEAESLSNESCILMAHKGRGEAGSKIDVFADAAIVGKMAPVLEGTRPWYYQFINGMPDGDYSAGDVTKLHDGNVNTITGLYGKRIQTWTGKTTAGTFIDFKILKDWLQVRLTEAIQKTVFNDLGVPYDNVGFGQIASACKAVLNQAKDERGVLVSYTTFIPRRQDIPVNDRANRKFAGMNFKVVFKGFVEIVTVNIIAEV
jgi:hypothetical protein